MQDKSASFFADICGRIRLVAAEREMSNLDLARAADVSYRTVYSAMKGEANLQDRIIAKFAKALGVSVQWLLTGQGDRRGLTHEPLTGPPLAMERGSGYSTKRDPPDTVMAAVRFLAKHFELDEKELMDCLMQHLERRDGAGSAGGSGARSA